jgi:hypothetical protein
MEVLVVHRFFNNGKYSFELIDVLPKNRSFITDTKVYWASDNVNQNTSNGYVMEQYDLDSLSKEELNTPNQLKLLSDAKSMIREKRLSKLLKD